MTNHPHSTPEGSSPQPSSPYMDHLQQHMAVGQGQSQYIQNPTMPAQPVSRSAQENNAVKAEKPTRSFILTLVFVGALACIALRVAEYLVTASFMNDAARWVSSQYSQYGENIDRESVAVPAFFLSSAQSALLLVSVFISSCLYFLFGCCAFIGRNWARVMLTILAVIGAVMSALKLWGYNTAQTSIEGLSQNPQSQGYIRALMVIYGFLCAVNLLTIILMWLPGANRYVRRLKAYRLARLMEQNQYRMQPVYTYQVVQPGYSAAQNPSAYNPNAGQYPGQQPPAGGRQNR